MTRNELRQLKYIVDSHKPWLPGRNVTADKSDKAYYGGAWKVNLYLAHLIQKG